VRRFDKHTTIQAPADRIYAYVSDMTRHGDWAGDGLEVTRSSDGPVAVGTSKDIPAGLRRDLERIKTHMDGTG
jgi:hypothetical protein